MLSAAAFAEDRTPSPVPEKSAEQAAAQRWQELREQFWPTTGVTTAAASSESARPGRTTLEQVSGETVSTKIDDTADTPPLPGATDSQKTSSERKAAEAGSRTFSDMTQPLASPPAGSVQLIALPDFLAADDLPRPSNGLNNALPPPPTPVEPGMSPIPNEQYPGEFDTIFQPITRIKPFYDYSPTAKTRYEYVCPQPKSIPEDQQVRCPNMQPLPERGSTDRYFATTNYCWLASDLYHHPLYFEDVQLERYGQKWPYGLQPIVSLGKFGGQFLALPYQMAFDPVHRPIYALGYYRPGDCTPELIYQIPFNAKAAATAAGVYTGFAFLIP
ncbi:hypothetical protein SAMN05421753_119102 [Planctomicrobium piriforme]|uniref:Uncharacterized protein n=2 Tax=Planctomicrobium piriforme TaxID=1576369 RepID=A0A1I3QYE9_9PLAN|nr:hypothetical protein SAMN05421753_119102 [Planctomicrobium piriforme]